MAQRHAVQDVLQALGTPHGDDRISQPDDCGVEPRRVFQPVDRTERDLKPATARTLHVNPPLICQTR